MRLTGVHVASVTFFDGNGKLSLSRMREHFTWLAGRGVSGLVPCATTGEGPTLTRVERREILAVAKAVASAHGLKVIAGCGSYATATALELINEAAELGCDAALVVTPYYNKPTPAGLLAHFHHLADKGPLPIVLYNVPGRTGVNMPVELAVELLKHPKIVGIKEASGQYGYWLGLSSAINLSEKSLLAGDDDAFAVIRALGGTGIISAAANVAPDAFVALDKAASAGRWEETFALQKKLFPLVRSLFLETNPAPAKRALEMMNRGEGNLRLPLVPVGAATEAAVKTALKGLELIP